MNPVRNLIRRITAVAAALDAFSTRATEMPVPNRSRAKSMMIVAQSRHPRKVTGEVCDEVSALVASLSQFEFFCRQVGPL